MREHSLQWQSNRNERAEHGMQMRHEHGSRNSLTGHVSHHKIKPGLARIDHIAVIATHQADRLVMIREVPSTADEILRRQERSLHLRGKLQVALQSISFVSVQMIQAE